MVKKAGYVLPLDFLLICLKLTILHILIFLGFFFLQT